MIRIPILALLALAAPVAALAKSAEERQLQGMAVIGNQELPKSLYIVPWKRAALGEAAPSPTSSLFAEGLAPLDPEVFRRELKYHDALQATR